MPLPARLSEQNLMVSFVVRAVLDARSAFDVATKLEREAKPCDRSEKNRGVMLAEEPARARERVGESKGRKPPG